MIDIRPLEETDIFTYLLHNKIHTLEELCASEEKSLLTKHLINLDTRERDDILCPS